MVCDDSFIRNIKKLIAKRKKIFLEEQKKNPHCPWCGSLMVTACSTCGKRYFCNKCGHVIPCDCPDYPIQEKFIK